jgi:hypothetical protein
MSLSPSLIDYIDKYIKEQWGEQKKNPRRNRALFDLRDKRRKKGRGYYA